MPLVVGAVESARAVGATVASTGAETSTFDAKVTVGSEDEEQPVGGSPAAVEDGEMVPEEAIPQL